MHELVAYLVLTLALLFGPANGTVNQTPQNAPVTVDGDPGPVCPPFCGTKG